MSQARLVWAAVSIVQGDLRSRRDRGIRTRIPGAGVEPKLRHHARVCSRQGAQACFSWWGGGGGSAPCRSQPATARRPGNRHAGGDVGIAAKRGAGCCAILAFRHARRRLPHAKPPATASTFRNLRAANYSSRSPEFISGSLPATTLAASAREIDFSPIGARSHSLRPSGPATPSSSSRR
jgi:hypothetical protein